MQHEEKEIRKIKAINYTVFAVILLLTAAILFAGWVSREQQSFTTEKWCNQPDERTKIVDDLLESYDLIGMSEEEIIRLLGMHNNDYGYFTQQDRFVYYMGPERSLFSIDSEWLILDFSDGTVTDCFITRD